MKVIICCKKETKKIEERKMTFFGNKFALPWYEQAEKVASIYT